MFTVLLIIIILIAAFISLYFQNKKFQRQLGTALLLEKLWMDHMLCTREYLIAAVYKLPFMQDTATRLLKNQMDLAQAYNKIYPGTLETIHSLLKDHIIIATKLVDAVINKKDNVEEFKKAWFVNAADIAKALASVNSNYNKEYLENMMKVHLETTTKELEALVSGRSGIPEFDTAVNHMMMFNYYLLDRA